MREDSSPASSSDYRKQISRNYSCNKQVTQSIDTKKEVVSESRKTEIKATGKLEYDKKEENCPREK